MSPSLKKQNATSESKEDSKPSETGGLFSKPAVEKVEDKKPSLGFLGSAANPSLFGGAKVTKDKPEESTPKK